MRTRWRTLLVLDREFRVRQAGSALEVEDESDLELEKLATAISGVEHPSRHLIEVIRALLATGARLDLLLEQMNKAQVEVVKPNRVQAYYHSSPLALAVLGCLPFPAMRGHVAQQIHAHSLTLFRLARDPMYWVREMVAKYNRDRLELVRLLAQDPDPRVRATLTASDASSRLQAVRVNAPYAADGRAPQGRLLAL